MMRSKEFEAALRPKRTIMTIIWAALLASVGIYVIVAYVASPSPEDVEVMAGMAFGLMIAALAAGAASLLVPPRLLPETRLREHMRAEKLDLARHVRNPQTGIVDPAQLARLESLPEVEQRLVTSTSFYFTPWIVGMALAEAVTIFGLVLAFLSGQPDAVLPFAAVSGVLLVIKRPRFDSYFTRLERLAR